MTFTDTPISRVQHFWDTRPCNIRASERPVGSMAYFNEVEARKYLVEPHIPKFADFGRWVGQRVLEVGCGIGTDTVNFARAGGHVTAVDLSAVSVALTRQRCAMFAAEADVYQWDAEHLDDLRGDQQFDLVYSFGVVHHSPHPERIVQGAAELLTPGGTLKVMVYHRRSWKVLWILARYGWGRWWQVDKVVARHSEAQTGCPITYTYTKASARRLVEDAGLRVTDVHADHIFPYRIRPYKRGELVKTWYWRLTPQRLFRRLERLFGWHLLITAVKP